MALAGTCCATGLVLTYVFSSFSVDAAQLTHLFFVERHADGPSQPRFDAIDDPRRLLGATFNLLLVTPERLHGLLDVCALVARGVAERLIAGPNTSVGDLCAAVEQRLS